MNSLAIIRATDILKLRSTLQEMIRAGLNFESKPKEINPSYTEKILSGTSGSSGKKYDVCALVPIAQDYDVSQKKIRDIPVYSHVILFDASHKLFNDFAKLMPVLPDLILPEAYSKEVNKPADSSKHFPVYLGVFVNREVQVQTRSGSAYKGVLKNADSIGVLFEPSDNSGPVFITWHDINKIMLPKEEK